MDESEILTIADGSGTVLGIWESHKEMIDGELQHVEPPVQKWESHRLAVDESEVTDEMREAYRDGRLELPEQAADNGVPEFEVI